MTEPTALQHILGYDQKTGEHHKPHMLVRIAQAMVMADRGISQRELATKIERSPEAVSRYFMGAYYTKPLRSQRRLEPEADTFARIRAYEDKVERAIEEIIEERKLHIPLAIGTSTERYIEMDVVYPTLMAHG